MQASIQYNNQNYQVNLSKPLDISLSLRGDDKNPVVWYLKAPKIAPVQEGNWIGKVSKGGSVNFNNIYFNPHGHTTHTECVGHITPEFHSINESLKTFFFAAKLVSVEPVKINGDEVITKEQIKAHFSKGEAQALIIRTLPNSIAKRSKHYSHTNWPYLQEEAAIYIRECGVEHLLIDLPSVDREEDGGKLLAHKAFWNYPKNVRLNATITELVYAPSRIEDGFYFLNLQPASFENDAAPSKPVLYKPELI
ncbi:cyclase family protein [Salinimicrobium sediminilitoris]|uniref:cyclase family protein n=1 Tax=Salinimicrobium sediminilitoris TaxID=2876715 RepID=UPI001E43D600|nr:cyclase family protein [Salinimicrobium sediminilitoris]MCC8361079.1 cyclase family protein [Salinimicrobium sediminilitoris]